MWVIISLMSVTHKGSYDFGQEFSVADEDDLFLIQEHQWTGCFPSNFMDDESFRMSLTTGLL